MYYRPNQDTIDQLQTTTDTTTTQQTHSSVQYYYRSNVDMADPLQCNTDPNKTRQTCFNVLKTQPNHFSALQIQPRLDRTT